MQQTNPRAGWLFVLAILSPLVHAQSCADLGALLGRPDELAKIASAAKLQQCTGRELVWVPSQVVRGSVLPAHYELTQAVPSDVEAAKLAQAEAGCFLNAKTMLVHSDRCKAFEERIDALSAQNNSCVNGFVVGGLMTIQAASVQAGCDYRP